MTKIDQNIVIILESKNEYGVGKIYARAFVQNNGLTESHEDGMILRPMLDSTYDWEGKYGHLNNLRVTEQHDLTDKATSYAWNVEYSDHMFIRLREAEVMLKTLRKIEREMIKIKDQFGYAASFGDYVARFAAVIGCGKFGVRTDEMQPNGTHYRWFDAQDMRTWVNRETTKHIATADVS